MIIILNIKKVNKKVKKKRLLNHYLGNVFLLLESFKILIIILISYNKKFKIIKKKKIKIKFKNWVNKKNKKSIKEFFNLKVNPKNNFKDKFKLIKLKNQVQVLKKILWSINNLKRLSKKEELLFLIFKNAKIVLRTVMLNYLD